MSNTTKPTVFTPAPYHRDLPTDALLEDLKKVAEKINAQTVFPQQYAKHGRYPTSLFRSRFGSWNNALEKIHLQPFHPPTVSNQDMLDDIARVAKLLNATDLSRPQYVHHGKYATTNIARRFDNWINAKKCAGLSPARNPPRNLTRQQLYDNFETLWLTLNRQPHMKDLRPPLSRYSLQTYLRHFGTFRKALAAFLQNQKCNHRPFTHLKADPNLILHKTHKEIRVSLRHQILTRDHFRCQLCGQSPATNPQIQLQIDHILPWSKGGETTPENLQTLCNLCNAGKSNSL